jgi:hypothetical protein
MSPVDLRRTPTACMAPLPFAEHWKPDPWEPQPTIRLGDDAAGLALRPIFDESTPPRVVGGTLVAHVEHPDNEEAEAIFVTVPLSEDDLAALPVAAWALKQDAERARGARP